MLRFSRAGQRFAHFLKNESARDLWFKSNERFKKIVIVLAAAVLLSAAAHQNGRVRTTSTGGASYATPSQPHVILGNLQLEIGPHPIKIHIEDGGYSIKDWAPFAVAFMSLLGALAAVWISARNTRKSINASLKSTEQTIQASMRNADATAAAAARTAEAAIWQRANEIEVADLQAKLDSFYGPLVLLLDTVHLIAQELRSRQPVIEKYRLLVSLFDKQWRQNLSKGDANLVKEICEQDCRIEEFIRENAHMMDIELRPHLSRAAAHFRVLDLAYKGELGDDPTHYRRYIYPEHLDAVLKLEIGRLKSRIAFLRANPATKPPLIEPLVIPPEFSLRPWPEPARAILPQPDDLGAKSES